MKLLRLYQDQAREHPGEAKYMLVANAIAQGVEDGFRRGVARLVGVEKHTLLVEVAALDLIGVGHDRGHPGD